MSYQSFPTLQPAFKATCLLDAGQFPCGKIHSGSTLIMVPFSGGFVKSVEGFEPKIDMEIKGGEDWFEIDGDMKAGRLKINVLASDTEGRCARFIAEGVTPITEEINALVSGDPNAKSSDWGFGVNAIRVQTGHPEYQALEGMVFAASQRFKKLESGVVAAEVHVSRVIPGTGNQS
ncbi:hypothetical protein MAPG_11357 [Magnaporthiopsis poae ATCC 64411]|uniref:Uncharacterized protein n=1 Tax=Magnaporthiopsis poae (strain ATCC 64411 / 73-15) TaxID=644358 RepID=A0A0C4EF22_MAGP6|nr:hypothetical protein MAPG_11357 [Magnaporthiopsis poae ATCC 64411]